MTFLKTTIWAISRSINAAKDTKKVMLAATAGHPHCILILLHSLPRFSPSLIHLAEPEGSRYSLMDCNLQGELGLLKHESPVLLRPLSVDRPGEGLEALTISFA